MAYLDPVRQMVQAAAEGRFVGRLDDARVPFLHRMIIGRMGEPQGECRNWEGIRARAGELAPLLRRA